MSLTPTLEEFFRRSGEIMAVARRHRATRVRIVGSVARGESVVDSDVDLLVDFEDEASLLDIVRLERALADLLGRPVDVLDAGALQPRSPRRRSGPAGAPRAASAHPRGRRAQPAVSTRPRGQRTDRDWLEDIDAHATLVTERAMDGKQRFLDDLERQDSILRRLELIGEAVTGLSKGLRDRHPEVPWSDLVAFRAKVIHHYFMVDLERVLAFELAQERERDGPW